MYFFKIQSKYSKMLQFGMIGGWMFITLVLKLFCMLELFHTFDWSDVMNNGKKYIWKEVDINKGRKSPLENVLCTLPLIVKYLTMVTLWALHSRVNFSMVAASDAVVWSGTESFIRRLHTKSVSKGGNKVFPTLWNQKEESWSQALLMSTNKDSYMIFVGLRYLCCCQSLPPLNILKITLYIVLVLRWLSFKLNHIYFSSYF